MLQILVSVLYFVNKVFLLFNKQSGWTIGAVASGAAIIYFFGLDLFIFCALEVACFFIMIYGALGQKNSKQFSIFVYGICAVVTLVLLIKVPETGWLEFATSLLFMLSFINLADNNRKLGWLLLGTAHGIMAFLTYEKSQYIFSSLQVASVIVCLLGFMYPGLRWKNIRLSKS